MGVLDLTVYTDVKEYVGIPASKTNQDDLINSLIPRQSQYIATYCSRNFGSATYTEYFDGSWQKELFLSNTPITAITAIYDDTDRAFGAGTQISSDDYAFISGSNDALNGIVQFDTLLTKGNQNIKIVYTAGYATYASAPKDLQHACILLVALSLRKGNVQVSVQGGQNERDTEIDSMWKEAHNILDHYRRYVIA